MGGTNDEKNQVIIPSDPEMHDIISIGQRNTNWSHFQEQEI
jgi:hypothetical protein